MMCLAKICVIDIFYTNLIQVALKLKRTVVYLPFLDILDLRKNENKFECTYLMCIGKRLTRLGL